MDNLLGMSKAVLRLPCMHMFAYRPAHILMHTHTTKKESHHWTNLSWTVDDLEGDMIGTQFSVNRSSRRYKKKKKKWAQSGSTDLNSQLLSKLIQEGSKFKASLCMWTELISESKITIRSVAWLLHGMPKALSPVLSTVKIKSRKPA